MDSTSASQACFEKNPHHEQLLRANLASSDAAMKGTSSEASRSLSCAANLMKFEGSIYVSTPFTSLRPASVGRTGHRRVLVSQRGAGAGSLDSSTEMSTNLLDIFSELLLKSNFSQINNEGSLVIA